MAKKKNPKLNDDDLMEDDGIPLEDTSTSSDDDLAITDDFDPAVVIAEESAGESEDDELTGYTMGEIGVEDMETENTEDAKMLEEGIKIAKQMESVGEDEVIDSDSSVAFDANDGDIFDDYEDDDAIYDRDDY